MFFLLLSDGSNFRVHFFYVSDARGARWGPRLRDSSVFPRLYSGLPPWAKSNSASARHDFSQSLHLANSKRVHTHALKRRELSTRFGEKRKAALLLRRWRRLIRLLGPRLRLVLRDFLALVDDLRLGSVLLVVFVPHDVAHLNVIAEAI